MAGFTGSLLTLLSLTGLVLVTVNGEGPRHTFTVDLQVAPIIRPDTPTTFNCTFNLDLQKVLLVQFQDHEARSMYMYEYDSMKGAVGSGFERVVSNPQVGEAGAWLSIDIMFPRCARDEVIRCVVFDRNLEHGQDDLKTEMVFWVKP